MSQLARRKAARKKTAAARREAEWQKRFGIAKNRDGSVTYGAAGGTYTDAAPSRGYDDWMTLTRSADYDTLPDRDALVGRARDLDRNNPFAKSLRHTLVREVVGKGIRPRPARSARALGWKAPRVRKYARNVSQIWNKWIPHAYVRGGTFGHLLRMTEAALVRDGESFLHFVGLPESRHRPYRLSIDMIEAHRVSTPNDRRLRGRTIRDGVEINNVGAPIAIWVEIEDLQESALFGDRVRSGNRSRWRRIPMMDDVSGLPNIVHVHDPDRPSTRSVPLTAGALDQIHVLGEFIEAELLAKKAEGCIAGAITSTMSDGLAAASASGEFELEPGMMARLMPGESITFLDPKRPGASYAPFVESMLRSIAFSCGLPYEVAFIAFSGMNYSNARTTLLAAQRYFEMRQETLIEKLCRPAFCRLLWESWQVGDLDVPNFPDLEQELCSVGFIGQGFKWVDPAKETAADVMQLENGLTSKSAILMRQGVEFEDVVGDLLYEREVEESEGLAQKAPAMTPEDDTDDTDEDDDKKMEEDEDA